MCESCGKAVRGKLNLEKIKEAAKFSCAMGAREFFPLHKSLRTNMPEKEFDPGGTPVESCVLLSCAKSCGIWHIDVSFH